MYEAIPGFIFLRALRFKGSWVVQLSQTIRNRSSKLSNPVPPMPTPDSGARGDPQVSAPFRY
jgi:hypothetical protein